MLDALRAWGSDRSDIQLCGQAALGRNLLKLLPEDEYDRQPIVLAGGSAMLAADARIDNRTELANQLGLAASEAASLSDSALLGLAWERWHLGLFDRTLGDIALAVWDRGKDELVMARSAMASKPLFYFAGDRLLAFASMPAGLHAVVPKALNLEHAAKFAGLAPNPGVSTIFSGIAAVRHGHAVRLRHGRREEIELWRPRRNRVRYADDADYADRLREEMERAVRAQLRRHHGKPGSQLSAGRDSNAVTGTAARLLAEDGGRLIAITAAPREGFDGPVLRGRFADESGLAARTAALHPNIDHLVCRTRPLDLAERMASLHALHHSPLIDPGALLWWEEMNRVAAANGVSVLLTGASGNLGLSAGGPVHFRDLLRESGAVRWLQTSAHWSRGDLRKWRNVMNVTLGPSLPQSLYQWLARATGRWEEEGMAVPILRPPYRQIVEARLLEAYGDTRPPASYFAARAAFLMKRDNPELMNLGAWGVEYRDPTADRRLIEFCFSLPADQLVSGGAARPVYESAFRGVVPPEVLSNPLRGLQSADWYEHFRKEEIGAAMRRHGRNPLVAELLDLEHLERMIDAWPSDFGRRSVIYTYGSTVLVALSLANFIDVHFPA